MVTCWMAGKSAWCPTSRTCWESASEVPKEAVMGECHASDVARNPPEEMPGKVFTGRYLTHSTEKLSEDVLGKASGMGSPWPSHHGSREMEKSVVLWFLGVEKLCVLQGLDSGKTMA